MELHFTIPVGNFPPALVQALRKLGYKSGSALALHVLRAGHVAIVPMIRITEVHTDHTAWLQGKTVLALPDLTLKDLVGLIFASLEGAERHECAEQFRYNGQRIFNPHVSQREQEELWAKSVGLQP